MFELREYQREAVDAFTAALDEGVQRPAIVLPTAKTAIESSYPSTVPR